jgi:hypothetical protein
MELKHRYAPNRMDIQPTEMRFLRMTNKPGEEQVNNRKDWNKDFRGHISSKFMPLYENDPFKRQKKS